jgi:hypothetical protein
VAPGWAFVFDDCGVILLDVFAFGAVVGIPNVTSCDDLAAVPLRYPAGLPLNFSIQLAQQK